MDIFSFILKKHQIWSNNPKISFRQVKLAVAAERGYSLFFLEKNPEVFREQ